MYQIRRWRGRDSVRQEAFLRHHILSIHNALSVALAKQRVTKRHCWTCLIIDNVELGKIDPRFKSPCSSVSLTFRYVLGEEHQAEIFPLTAGSEEISSLRLSPCSSIQHATTFRIVILHDLPWFYPGSSGSKREQYSTPHGISSCL